MMAGQRNIYDYSNNFKSRRLRFSPMCEIISNITSIICELSKRKKKGVLPIPTYVMWCFFLSKELCQKLAIQFNFLKTI